MDKFNRRLDIINKMLGKYHVEPITEQEIVQKWEEANRDLAPGEARKSLDDFWHESHINLMVDLHFTGNTTEDNPELAGRFMDWLDNGDCTEAKDAALFKKFEEIHDEYRRTLESADPVRDQQRLDDLWRRIREREKQSAKTPVLPN